MRNRLTITATCGVCGTKFEKQLHHYKSAIRLGSTLCCSKKCKSKKQEKGIWKKCLTCKKDIYVTPSRLAKSDSGDHFCSKHCATIVNNSRHKKWINHPHYKTGISAYREKALETYGESCSNTDCPLSHIVIPKKMLDVHHIDGDRTNNKVTNLKVLCVWCHAIETRKWLE